MVQDTLVGAIQRRPLVIRTLGARSWRKVPATLTEQLRKLGLPYPLAASDALPATVDPKAPATGAVADADDVPTSLAGARSSTDPRLGDVIEEEDDIAKGSAEEGNAKEHHMTHLPTNPLCEVCLKAKAHQRKPNTCCGTRTRYCNLVGSS